jgi:pimeloyl-ACP methyl ester carboxylesterase
MSSRSIARRALAAPNRQFKPSHKARQFTLLTTNFPVQRVQVGPPPATLELTVIEPGDYGAKAISRFTKHRSLFTGLRAHYRFEFGIEFAEYPPPARLETNNLRGAIFLLPGYGGDRGFMLGWGLALAQAGYRTILVDPRGHGHSTGDRVYFGGIERTDLVQCLDALVQRGVCDGRVGALGISYGAVLALQWAAIDTRVESVTAISPYADPATAVKAYLSARAPLMPRSMKRKVVGNIVSDLAARWPDLTTETAVRGSNRPILFVRGDRDKLCGQEFLDRLKKVAPNGSEAMVIPHANHLDTGLCNNQLEVAVTNWFEVHLAH